MGERQDVLAARFRGQYPRRIQREVRLALSLNDASAPREVVERLVVVADQFGLAVSDPPQPLPWASLEDIHLICWVAINPGIVPSGGSSV